MQLEQAAGVKASSQVVGSGNMPQDVGGGATGANGVAYGGDDNMNLSPAELQAKMLNQSHMRDLDKMTDDEVELEIAQRKAKK